MMRDHLAACTAGVLAAVALAAAMPLLLQRVDFTAGNPSFRAISAHEARRLLAHPDAVLIEVLSARHGSRALPGAVLAFAEGPLPPALEPAPPAVVVVAGEPGAGYRMAARLARAGILEVNVVAGGLTEWQGLHPRWSGRDAGPSAPPVPLAGSEGPEGARSPARGPGA